VTLNHDYEPNSMQAEWKQNQLLGSSDPNRLDADAIPPFLPQLYWCKGIPRIAFEHSRHSWLCYGLYDANTQSELATLQPLQSRCAWTICSIRFHGIAGFSAALGTPQTWYLQQRRQRWTIYMAV